MKGLRSNNAKVLGLNGFILNCFNIEFLFIDLNWTMYVLIVK